MKHKIILLQKVPGQWWSMPMEREVEATDLATAIVLAWTQANEQGVIIKDFRV